MSPQMKYNAKVTIGIATGVITVLVFVFSLGVGFAKNNTDHIMIKKDIVAAKEIEVAETIRSKAADAATAKDIGDIKITQTAISTILAAQSKTLEKIEKKLP